MKKYLKYVAMALGIFIVLIALLYLIGPKDFKVERSLVIKAPRSVIYKHVKSFVLWQEWSPWMEMDTSTQVTYEGSDGTVGSAYSWVGKKTGKGTISCASIKENEEFNFNMHFMEPMDMSPQGYFKLEDTIGGTKVRWAFYGENLKLMRILGNFFTNDRMIGPQFERGLQRIKEITEKEAAAMPSYKVNTIDMPEMKWITFRKQCLKDSINGFFQVNMPLTFSYVMSNKYKTSGAPSAIFYTWMPSEKSTDVAIAIPVSALGNTIPPFATETLAAGKCLEVDYYGPYDQMEAAYDAIDAYQKEHHLNERFGHIEEYVTDPASVNKDYKKVLTKIYLPIK